MTRLALEAGALGIVTVVCASVPGGASFVLAVAGVEDGEGKALATWIFWPILVPVVIGGMVLGLWVSHRLDRPSVKPR